MSNKCYIWLLLSNLKIEGIFSSYQNASDYIFTLWSIDNKYKFTGRMEYEEFCKKYQIVKNVLDPKN